LTVECLARWPQTLKYFNWTGQGGQAPNAPDAYLVWQLFPGQGNRIPTGPNAGKFIGLNANWEESRREFDVDTANGWTVPGRVGSSWNRPSFSFQDPATQGRAISFNFKKLKTWNGDQNRDAVLNVADKFPVRVRLFTDHLTYYNKTLSAAAPGWPNHLANAGGNPATTPVASRNPSYLEGVTYVVDKGSPVYNVQITDDPLQPNPGAPGTLTGQGPGTYTAQLMFLIKYGAPNYLIEADTWYTGVFGANNSVPIVTVKAAAAPPNQEGPFNMTINVPAAQPNGNYTFAIRVTDGNGDTSTFVWPNVVGLFPQALMSENFESGNLNQWTISGTIGNAYGAPSGNFDWRNVTSSPYANHAAYATGVTYGGTMNPPQGSRMGVWGEPQGGTNTFGPGATARYITLTNAVPAVPGQTYTFSAKTNGICYWEQPGNTYWYGGIAPQISWNGGASWEAGSAWIGTGAQQNYSYYNHNNEWGGYAYAFCSSALNAGGSWITRTRSFVAPAGSPMFKIRFAVFSYNTPFQSGATWLPVCGPQAIDDIIVQ
jgi:hypothetical protein